jgi:hypothetical protein
MQNTQPRLGKQLQEAREEADNSKMTLADYVQEEMNNLSRANADQSMNSHKHHQSEQITDNDFKPKEFFKAGQQFNQNTQNTPEILGEGNGVDCSMQSSQLTKENEVEVAGKLNNIQAGKAYLEKKI